MTTNKILCFLGQHSAALFHWSWSTGPFRIFIFSYLSRFIFHRIMEMPLFWGSGRTIFCFVSGNLIGPPMPPGFTPADHRSRQISADHGRSGNLYQILTHLGKTNIGADLNRFGISRHISANPDRLRPTGYI